MKYQRVLYTKRLTAELKSKLRIASFDKRRASKRNVYFVSFASTADMKHADRIAKRIRDITLKLVQRFPTDTPRKRLINDKSLPSSTACSTSLSATAIRSAIPNKRSTFVTPEPSSAQRVEETLEERAVRVLGARVVIDENTETIPASQAANFASCGIDANSSDVYTIGYERNRQQLIDGMKSCLKTMETARQAADRLCHLYSKIS